MMHSSIKVLSYTPSFLPDGVLADLTTRSLAEGFVCGLRTVRNVGDTQARPNRRFWMWRDIRILQDHYPSATPVVELALALGRSVGSIRAKARQLDLRRPFRHPRQIPETVLDAQRQRLERDLVAREREAAALGSTLLVQVNKTVGGRVIWTDDLVRFVGDLWKRLYSPAAIGGILRLNAGIISTLAHRIELPRRTKDGPVDFLESVPEGGPLAAPVCQSIERMMEPIRCIDTGRLFYRRPGDFGRRRCRAARAVVSKASMGTLH